MPLLIDDAKLGDVEACARMACESEIGSRYGFERQALAGKMRDALASGAIMVVAREEHAVDSPHAVSEPLGFAWIDPRGAFGSAPYLKLIAVDGTRRSAGVGAALLAEYERRTATIGKVWTLMVSDFNVRAIAFYERHGYENAGKLRDFAREGIAEILMVKKKP
jgi:ribosomal protein S18 acetylase RimI-like enzyme